MSTPFPSDAPPCGYCRWRTATAAMVTASGTVPACRACQERYAVIAIRVVNLDSRQEAQR